MVYGRLLSDLLAFQMLLKLLMLRVAFMVTRGMSSFSRRSLAILALCLLLRLLRVSSLHCLTVHRPLLIWANMTRQTPSVTIARVDKNTMHLLQRNPNYLRIYEEIQQNFEWTKILCLDYLYRFANFLVQDVCPLETEISRFPSDFDLKRIIFLEITN